MPFNQCLTDRVLVVMAHRNLQSEIDDVLERHRIAPEYRSKFNTLIREGRIRDPEFRTRLQNVANYETALYEILELLSRSCRHLFEPSSFESLGVPNGN